MKKTALLIIDYQYDFVNPKGSLYVLHAEKLKPYIQALMLKFHQENQLIIASMDDHPNDHASFQIWPKHCVQNSMGAKLYLDPTYLQLINKIIYKGQHTKYESYSAFFDEAGTSNGLDEYLKSKKITKLILVGVALDICVLQTYNHAIELGYLAEIDLKGSAALKG
ncbi:isochorismatase family protein [Williamsoniiplasma lucivorax]|uniref:nicotinamidase n=1 Tax=Williamsoniiplasma lucivorax TaxID=209274 RepID=A0A2S5RFC6_9MOLU|nr:isochorismatase family protein [Williamsoniiplasma lucivorax]PPE06029.1 pyrazinamidase/nicotinamidase [Williamsoniiplasma lucivorax]